MGENTPSKGRPWWLVAAFLIYFAGFSAATLWDLALNQAVYTPANLYAIIMECFGWYPAFLPALLLAMLLATQPALPRGRLWQRPVAALVALAGFAALFYASRGYMLKRGLLDGPNDPLGMLWLIAGLVFAGALLFAVLRLTPPARIRMTFFGLWGAVYMAANQALIYPVKHLWARTRFDELVAAGSFEHFTPWYQPLGFGGSSFPSGHTANACGIFMLLVLCDLFPAWAKYRKATCACCWGYILLMALARVLIGRHFLSDTLAASAIMAVLFYAMRSTKLYKNGLRKTLIAAEAAKEQL